MAIEPAHIVLVSNTTWNIHNFRLNVIDQLLAHGHRITVIAPVDEYIHYTERYATVEHIDLHYLQRDGTNPIRDIRLTIELYGQYRRLKPDLVVHYTVKPNIFGGVAARLLRLKSIAVVTGLGFPFLHTSLARVLTQSLYRVTNRFHRRVIFENQDDQQLFIETGLVAADRSVSVKGCGVDPEHFTPGTPTASNGHLTFTFVGRLLYDKGIGEFVEAARQIAIEYHDVRFIIIGQLDESNPSAVRKADLIRWVKHPNIYYLGARQDVRPFIRQADCIVLPSYREGFPRALTEAMAMAKPVISTDTAGCREAVEHGKTGFLVSVRNADALVSAMREFIALSASCKAKMGQEGREKVLREFSSTHIAAQLHHIFAEVLTSP